ncbi:MAG TPA: hypothetical protein VIA18_19205, partial [Polyangia bacterium]|nr:hypothetical protein [Polyangia bacterium]
MSRLIRRLGPATAALVCCGVVWFGARALVWRVAGPVGFDVTTTNAAGAVVAHARASRLITPEVAPTPPKGGTLVARATFLAEIDGSYEWQLGGSTASTLFVDGTFVYAPKPGRVAMKSQPLAAGLHQLEVTLRNADNAGGVAFGVRPPWRPWRGALAGRGEVVALPIADVRARLGAHPVAIIRLLDAAPTLLLLALLGIVALILRADGRAKIAAHVVDLARDRDGRRFLIVLAFTAMALPMLWPFLQPGFFACGEEESYIVRLGEYKLAILGGVPMGRWWPDPVFGRGYPFLCVYAPLLYILATPLLLVGMTPIVTIKILSAAVVVVGGWATYAIVKRHASTPASLIAAALYMYAPYLHTDVWIREDLAEALGFACFPLALLTLEHALDRDNPDGSNRTKRARDIAFLALALAALGCSHNITAYFAVFFLGLWLGLRVALHTVDQAGIVRTSWGALGGFLLCVFYALPALGDANRIWIERVMRGYYNPAGHFMAPLSFFVAEPRWSMRLYVGTGPLIGVIAGLVAVFMKRPPNEPLVGERVNSRTLVVLAASGLLLSFIIASRPLGPVFVAYVPLANHVQFPWRLLLFAASLAPLCAPAAVDGFLRTARARWTFAVIAIVGMIMLLAPVYGPPAPLVRSRLDVQPFLRSLETDYVTSMNEYLPITVRHTVPRFGDVAHVVAGQIAIADTSRSPGR